MAEDNQAVFGCPRIDNAFQTLPDEVRDIVDGMEKSLMTCPNGFHAFSVPPSVMTNP